MENMQYLFIAGVITLIGLTMLNIYRKEFRVREGSAGLLFRYGKFVRILDTGRAVIFGRGYTLETIEMRAQSFIVAGQEVVTSEGVPIRISGIVRYSVEDPFKAHVSVMNIFTELYQSAQIALREAVFDKSTEQLMGERFEVSEKIVASLQEQANGYGLKIEGVAIRDIVLGGDLKRAMSDQLKAKLEAQAQLERARGEAATMRSLANTAKMIEKSPALMQLRMLQAIEKGDATVVIGTDASVKVPIKTE